MNEPTIHHAGCFCGAVQFTLAGDPEVMAYCHCDSCRHWSAGPVSAFTLWQPDSGRCQGRCRTNQAAFSVTSTSVLAGLPGFRETIFSGTQFRVDPLQRSGRFCLAAS